MKIIEILEIILPNGKGDWTPAEWGNYFAIVFAVGAIFISVSMYIKFY